MADQSSGRVYDIAVLGGGPGGYPAAIKAAQCGKKVALIEAKELGGTCLNRGCIPSKTLIANAEVLKRVQEAEEFGVIIGNVAFDFSKMVQRKDTIVTKVRNNLEGLIASNHIDLIRGFGKLVSPRQIQVTGQDSCLIYADKIILATGSEPRAIPSFPFDEHFILDSTSLLNLRVLPEHLLIIGGGIIGCEFASLYNALGVKVTILEALDRLLPMEDKSVSAALSKAFLKKGIEIHTNALVEKASHDGKKVTVNLANNPPIEATIALVAIGRTLNTRNIGLERAGIVPLSSGIISVNEHMETSVSGIYAVGDIASRWWLAHVASHQGLVAAKHACGQEASMHYNAIPSVIFTTPEIGTVGMSLENALERGYKAVVGAFPFHALGKSQAALQTDGFAQIVTDRNTGQILGAQVVGHEASTLVAEMAVAIANELTIESIAETIHAHPTVAEVWLEAALVASSTPLHLPPQTKAFERLKK